VQSGVGKASAHPMAHASEMYRILKFVASSLRLDSILPTEDSILDPCYEIWGVTSLIIIDNPS
jgi:hypothetical protein